MRPAQARNRAGTCNRKSERSRRLPPRRICCGDRTTTSARASRPFAYQNRYTITSADYGPFTAPCDARLRRLIREIGAIAQLQAMQETDAFKKAALEAGKSPFRAARSLIDDPVGTLSAIPEGISSIFDRASEQIRRSGRSRHEDGAAKSLLAVSGYKRERAAKLGVDVPAEPRAIAAPPDDHRRQHDGAGDYSGAGELHRLRE